MNKLTLILVLCVVVATATVTAWEWRYPDGMPEAITVKEMEGILAETRPDERETRLEGYLTQQSCFMADVDFVGDTIIIDPGPCFVIGNIFIKEVGEDNRIAERELIPWQGKRATKDNLDRLRRRLIEKYLDDGYYFTALHTDSVSLADNNIVIYFRLISGGVVRIDQVRFKGLRKTSPDYLRKLAGLNQNDVFRTELIDRSTACLMQSGFLQLDSMPQVMASPDFGRVQILYFVRERRSSQLELGGGYQGTEEGDDGSFVGLLDFKSLNLFGHGRRIGLLFERKDKSSTLLEAEYGQTFFIPDPIEVSLNIRQIDYDSSYYQFRLGGGVSLALDKNAYLSGALEWIRTEPQRSSQPSSRDLAGSIKYLHEDLDFQPNPGRGYLINLTAGYYRHIVYPDGSTTSEISNDSRLTIRGGIYLPLIRPLIFHLNAEGRAFLTGRDLIDYSEQNKLGGYGSLRGYRQDQFAGRRTGLMQAELRLRFSSALTFYLLGDGGYIYEKKADGEERIYTEETTKIGYGAGIFIGNDRARLNFETAWGEDDRLGDGKIHMKLTTWF